MAFVPSGDIVVFATNLSPRSHYRARVGSAIAPADNATAPVRFTTTPSTTVTRPRHQCQLRQGNPKDRCWSSPRVPEQGAHSSIFRGLAAFIAT